MNSPALAILYHPSRPIANHSHLQNMILLIPPFALTRMRKPKQESGMVQ
jgi:hypothetical protein